MAKRQRRPDDGLDVSTEGAAAGAARHRILEAAMSLFAEQGFAATRTKTIAERAGVPNGLVFYYFPSKEALLLSLVDERSTPSRLRDYLASASTDQPRRALVEAVRHHFEAVGEYRELARLFWREALTHPEIRRRLISLFDEVRLPVAEYLDRAIADGRLAPFDTRIAARLFTASMVLSFLLDEPPNLPRLARETVSVLLPPDRTDASSEA